MTVCPQRRGRGEGEREKGKQYNCGRHDGDIWIESSDEYVIRTGPVVYSVHTHIPRIHPFLSPRKTSLSAPLGYLRSLRVVLLSIMYSIIHTYIIHLFIQLCAAARTPTHLSITTVMPEDISRFCGSVVDINLLNDLLR